MSGLGTMTAPSRSSTSSLSSAVTLSLSFRSSLATCAALRFWRGRYVFPFPSLFCSLSLDLFSHHHPRSGKLSNPLTSVPTAPTTTFRPTTTPTAHPSPPATSRSSSRSSTTPAFSSSGKLVTFSSSTTTSSSTGGSLGRERGRFLRRFGMDLRRFRTSSRICLLSSLSSLCPVVTRSVPGRSPLSNSRGKRREKTQYSSAPLVGHWSARVCVVECSCCNAR
jgi:hypothetical protein